MFHVSPARQQRLSLWSTLITLSTASTTSRSATRAGMHTCMYRYAFVTGFIPRSCVRSFSNTNQGSRHSLSSSSIGTHRQNHNLDALDAQQVDNSMLHTSNTGLDPSTNRFHAPIVYHERYSFSNWPATHTFPMDKFAAIARALLTTSKKTHPQTSNLPRPLVRSHGVVDNDNDGNNECNSNDFFRPLDFDNVPRSWLAEPTGPIQADFVHDFLSGNLDKEHCRYIGFREHTSRPELIERTVLEVAGTVLASQLAAKWGIASNVAGGTHHAHPSGGAGYTILNDLAVTANFLTDETLNGGTVKGIRKVLVIDCDVHQGDGTAKFSKLHSDGRLFTLSLHCASNYPRPKATSTYDVGLSDGIRDEEYMDMLKASVNRALEEVQPDFVLYDAGVDIYEKDSLGRINISEQGIRARDRFVLETCVDAGLPVTAVIGGGYDKDVGALARRHAIVHEECAYVWRKHRMWEQSVPRPSR